MLNVEIYNPYENGFFPTNSTIISGIKKIILIDTQFEKKHITKLASIIKSSNKILDFIYISKADPDFYFGTEHFSKEFPGVKIVSSPTTSEKIEKNKIIKLKYWANKIEVPETVVTPEPFQGIVTFEGYDIHLQDFYVFIPIERTLISPLIFGTNIHVWLADYKTPYDRNKLKNRLRMLRELNPARVIPGHFYENTAFNNECINYTLHYVIVAENYLAKSSNSQELISSLSTYFPARGTFILEFSAKVLKKEIDWD